MITRDTQVTFVGPEITEARFAAILCSKSKIAAQDATDMYQAAVNCRVSPLFFLAFFWHESNFGSLGVCHDYQTCSPGNTRSSRIGVRESVTVPGKGTYIKYSTWRLGAMDACYRLVDPNFAYVKAGAKTIAQILPIWAPASDSNDPAKYISSVVNLMNQWIGERGGMFDLNNIPFRQSPNYDAGGNSMKKVVIHTTEGSYGSSVNWLLSDAAQASAHYIINEDGSECTQLVKDSDVAWHTGNAAYNRMCIGIEHSWFSDGRNGPPPESLYQAGAKLTVMLCRKHGITPNRGNIIAHAEVPPPNDHVDPGPNWDWGKFMAYVTQAYNATIPVNPTYDPLMDYFNAHGGEAVFGKPVGGQYGTNGSIERDFELSRMYVDKNSGQVMVTMKDRVNPDNKFSIGPGLYGEMQKRGLVALTDEQYYRPSDPTRTGLGQRSFAWAKDSTGQVFILMAFESVDGSGTWEIKTVKEV